MRPLPFSANHLYGIAFWLAIALWILPEIVASKKKRSTDRTRSQDKGSMVLIVCLCYTSMLAGIYASIHWSSFAFTAFRSQIFVLGVAIWMGGLGLRWYSIVSLGRYFTFDMTVKADQSVIDTGPYRYIRHPSYLGALSAALGFALTLGNWATMAITLSMQGIGYGYRIYIEEASLANTLGAKYINYAKKTWLLVPFLF